ncbi:MAG TPA: GNAT family N-acetyltransferase [Ktedonobacterales bacterium]
MQTLATERLVLRPFELTDATVVEALAGDVEVARTSNVPHPYPVGGARAWITAELEAAAHGLRESFAIVRCADGQLVGCMMLGLAPAHRRAALGYWIGRPFWGQGYATEAGARVVAYAFEERALHRVMAHVIRHKRASTRVLEKLGMVHEGTLRQHLYHWGTFEDVDVYGLLQVDYAAHP